jgi:hypothetical protein
MLKDPIPNKFSEKIWYENQIWRNVTKYLKIKIWYVINNLGAGHNKRKKSQKLVIHL